MNDTFVIASEGVIANVSYIIMITLNASGEYGWIIIDNNDGTNSKYRISAQKFIDLAKILTSDNTIVANPRRKK